MIHGWCMVCHKIKRVRVNMARSIGKQVYQGVCADCEESDRG